MQGKGFYQANATVDSAQEISLFKKQHQVPVAQGPRKVVLLSLQNWRCVNLIEVIEHSMYSFTSANRSLFHLCCNNNVITKYTINEIIKILKI